MRLSDVENSAGRFPQVSGLRFEYQVSKPAGSRVVSIAVGGVPLDDTKTYTLATSDFPLHLEFGQKNQRVVIELPEAKFWSPQSPHLYKLVAHGKY